MLHLGIDIGSVSVNLVVMNQDLEILHEEYRRHKGRPAEAALEAIATALQTFPDQALCGCAATGSGSALLAPLLGVLPVNEVVAQARAVAHLHPAIRTVIEIGGEDSKVIFLRPGRNGSELADFNTNTICAAGTGSFLDQQAHRLGLSIEQFGQLTLQCQHPPRLAGRCSVFAKSDMIHLQQKATPTQDIVAGLCMAMARNFKSTVGAARTFERPVSFQGGVAANPGIVRAFERVLELGEGELLIPKHFASMGAIGAVLVARDSGYDQPFPGLEPLRRYLASEEAALQQDALPPLRESVGQVTGMPSTVHPPVGERIPAYLGVDVGSISTNVVVLDHQQRVLSKRYLMTAGEPIEAVRQGLREVGAEVASQVEIRGACTTGSGRYLIADFIGADIVKNEITAQARAAVAIDPRVDTIFEIGGQDSKYVSLENGAIVDFEMNKVCAAGTGSFLEEQAEKLGIKIEEEFGNLALAADQPVNLGERCTVFMESELVRHQQAGSPTDGLVAGLSYSIVYNYLNRVVAGKRVGNHIFFQGGVAANQGVAAAFAQVTGKPIIVPEHYEVTGAIGCSLIAMENDQGQGSKFKGFDLSNRKYDISSFECKDCPNRCEVNRVTLEGERPRFYGSRCEKYDVERRTGKGDHLPDLFAERERMMLEVYQPAPEPRADAPTIGMPRALIFYDLFPLWNAFFQHLGCRVVLSGPTTKQVIHRGVESSVVETCFPMKVALGQVDSLLEQGVDYLFLPSVINLPKRYRVITDSFVCPYVQSFPYTVLSALPVQGRTQMLTVPIWLQLGDKHLCRALLPIGRQLGKSAAQVRAAMAAGASALAAFGQAMLSRGEQALSSLGPEEQAVVVVSRSYNGCDPGANLEIPRKLRDLGVQAIPMDFLPLDAVPIGEQWDNMYWRYGQRILSAAEIIAQDPRLTALYLTNFGCGPDSFVGRFFRTRLGEKPFLQIEVDEHSADAGMITRCEAFMDSLASTRGRQFKPGRRYQSLGIGRGTRRRILVPYMSDHALGLAAAFEACGLQAEVLPEPDQETLHWGRHHTSGKECYPCIVTTGDMVKYTKRPDFDRDAVAFFMGGSGGPCRFGQYNALQRMVLDDLGYPDVPIYAPNQASSFYNDLGIVGRRFLHLGWQAIVAIDMLYKALRETKPYELEPGDTARVYWQWVHEVCRALRAQEPLLPVLDRAAAAFKVIPVDRSQPKPCIGVVGEIYVRFNAFSNSHLVDAIEQLGGEVWLAPVYEWFLYRNFRRSLRSRLDGNWRLLLKNWLQDGIMKRDEHHLASAFHHLRNATEPATTETLHLASPYLHHSFEGEAILTVGKAIDFVHKHLDGVVSAMPFTCMPGTIAHALIKVVKDREGGFPFLNMVYDGTEQATTAIRLEAFMYQARQHMQHRDRAGAVAASTSPKADP